MFGINGFHLALKTKVENVFGNANFLWDPLIFLPNI